MRLVWAFVNDIITPDSCEHSLPPVYECSCRLDDDTQGTAIVMSALSGDVAAGDRVLLNTTAVDLGLGTGGKHFVVARVPAGEEPRGVAFDSPASHGGHIMKLRYTPLQRDVLSVESQESPWHKSMERATSLEHVPVVCCGLHSQVVLVAAAIKARAPHLRVGYVMTDEAALSLDFSRAVAQARACGLIDVTVASGQAFGGDFEAINTHSGMLAACHVGGCDVIITAIGPGVAGTGTPLGHGGVAQGEAINAVGALGGVPIACARMSWADARERHRGLSHHTITALETIALTKAILALPHIEDKDQAAYVDAQLEAMSNPRGHEAIELEQSIFDEEALRGIHVTTMGRGPHQDPLFFEAAFAAGAVAAQFASEREG